MVGWRESGRIQFVDTAFDLDTDLQRFSPGGFEHRRHGRRTGSASPDEVHNPVILVGTRST